MGSEDVLTTTKLRWFFPSSLLQHCWWGVGGRVGITLPVVSPQICFAKLTLWFWVWFFSSEGLMCKNIHGVLAAVIAHSSFFYSSSCEVEQVETSCFKGWTISCFSTVDTEKDRRMKLKVFTAQFYVHQHDQAGEEQGSRAPGQVAPDSPTGGLTLPLSVLGRERRAVQVEPGTLQGRVHTLLTHTCLFQQHPSRYACAHSSCSLFLLFIQEKYLLRAVETKRHLGRDLAFPENHSTVLDYCVSMRAFSWAQGLSASMSQKDLLHQL